MGGAAEEVLGGVLRLAAAWAEGGGGGADPVFEGFEGGAVPRSQLGTQLVLVPLDRSKSATSTSGAQSERTPLGLLLPIAAITVLVWIVFLATFMSVMQPSTNRSLTCC